MPYEAEVIAGFLASGLDERHLPWIACPGISTSSQHLEIIIIHFILLNASGIAGDCLDFFRIYLVAPFVELLEDFCGPLIRRSHCHAPWRFRWLIVRHHEFLK